jgi:hypothetical protein
MNYFKLLLLSLILLTACGPAPAVTSAPATETIPSTRQVTPTLTTTSTFTPSPTFTSTSTSTITFTPWPTLESAQAKETIKELLQSPIDCAAPCFWGIIPGKTTLGEAKSIFTQLGLDLAHTYSETNEDFYSLIYELDSGLQVTPTLTIQDDVVKNIEIGLEPVKSQGGIARKRLAYSPEELIKRYGQPSEVDFNIDRGPRIFFEMNLYFDTLDLIVEYASYNTLRGTIENPRACPLTDQVSIIKLWMGKNPKYPPRVAVPLEKATSMTMDQFSKLMTGDPNKACINFKGEMFP